ncbi:MAG: hypothetical protein HYX32_07120 [Actinobacteria bacterium]|nr:hypothetical protein [Actinomycetota bacterium]
MQRDPLDGVDGTPTVANPYHYVANDPLNKVDPLGLRPKDSLEACTALYVAETSFFGRNPGSAEIGLQANIRKFDRGETHCGQRLASFNKCAMAGGTSWDWNIDGAYIDGGWACGRVIPDCSKAVVPIFCERQAGLLKISYGVLGASIAAIGIGTGNSYLVGCGIGVAGNSVFGNGNNVHRDAAGGCVAGAGAASGNPYVGCVAGALGLGVISESGGSVSAVAGCLAGAVGAGVGSVVPAGQKAAFLTVGKNMERLIQCLTGGTAAVATNSSDFHAAWAAFYGCVGGIVSSAKDIDTR